MSIQETMSAWGRNYILEENPAATIPEGAVVDFFEDNWIDNGYGGCETCGNGGPQAVYEVRVSYTTRDPKYCHVDRTYRGTFGELIEAIMTWEAAPDGE